MGTCLGSSLLPQHCESSSHLMALSIAKITIISTLKPKAPFLPQQQALLEPPAGNTNQTDTGKVSGGAAFPAPSIQELVALSQAASHPSPPTCCLLAPQAITTVLLPPLLPRRKEMGPAGMGQGGTAPLGLQMQTCLAEFQCRQKRQELPS